MYVRVACLQLHLRSALTKDALDKEKPWWRKLPR
jgi:hypothetical protein